MSSRRQLTAILFSDIVGYTAMMQRSEEQAVSTAEHYRQVLEDLVARHQGEVSQDYGDGSLCLFKSVVEAVTCAIALQKTFRRPPYVPLRIGVHIGEVLLEDGKAFGDGVNIASRIESLAEAGSVLLSEKIVEEIKNKEGFRVKPLGAFQFKNVFHPIKVYALVDDALYVPERHELEGKTENRQKAYDLPAYPNVFVGRTHHVNALSALFQQDTTSLVTLLGPGGIGKTRLAVKIGELLAGVFEHGVCFVPLDTVTDYEQVPLYIGHRLGLKVSFNETWTDRIVDFLSDKHLLLILDNLEQILGSASVIARILQTCPRTKILVTSRETLGLSREIEYPLDSLNRPNPNLFPSPVDLLKFEAVSLFVQKAQIYAPDFLINEDNAAAIVRICQELDGLPLPIELAAARIKLFSPELILHRLKSNSDLLKTTSKDVAPRHQTIRSTIKWSYDLLDAGEQHLFQQLSLFRGGFTPAALDAVCPGYDSLEIIESFLNKSLIVKDKELHRIPRFRMLKLIRDFGLERLESNLEKEACYQKFAQYFLSFIEEGKSKLSGAEQSKWIALIEAEYENLEAALGWLIAHQPEMAGRLGASFWLFHLTRGFLKEGLVIVETLLSLPIDQNKTRAKLLEGAGVLSQNRGDYDKAKDYFNRCLDLWKDLGDKTEIVKALNNLGWVEWRIGNYDQAIAHSESALNISVELDDSQGRAKSLNNLAWTCFFQGLFEKAARLQQQILDIHSRAGYDRGIAFAKTNLSWAFLRIGKILEAGQLIDHGIERFEALKDQQLTAFSRGIKAELLREKGDFETAGEILRESCLPDFEKIGDAWGIAFCHNRLGRLYFHRKDFTRASFHLIRSMELFRDSQDKFGNADTALWLSRLSWAMGHSAAAGEWLDQCITLADQMGANELLKEAYFEIGLRALQQKSYDLAMQNLGMSDFFAEKLGAYQYDRFRSQIRPVLESLRQFFVPGQAAIAPTAYERRRPGKETHLTRFAEEEEVKKRMQKLLNSIPAAGSSSLPAQRDDDPAKSNILSPEDPFVRQVRRIIEAHLPEHQFTVKDLCQKTGVSHSQLHRRLRALTGQPVTHFIRLIRLEKARELLSDPQLTVAAVAYDTGFKDPDYFYRVFKQAFHMTPGEFRKAALKKE